MKVIVAEDEADLAFLFMSAVTERGDIEVEVVTHDFGQMMSVDFWAGVDCAVIDLMMPVDGHIVLYWMAKNVPGVRRVVWTASGTSETAEDLYADVVLHKPCSLPEIVASLRG